MNVAAAGADAHHELHVRGQCDVAALESSWESYLSELLIASGRQSLQ